MEDSFYIILISLPLVMFVIARLFLSGSAQDEERAHFRKIAKLYGFPDDSLVAPDRAARPDMAEWLSLDQKHRLTIRVVISAPIDGSFRIFRKTALQLLVAMAMGNKATTHGDLLVYADSASVAKKITEEPNFSKQAMSLFNDPNVSLLDHDGDNLYLLLHKIDINHLPSSTQCQETIATFQAIANGLVIGRRDPDRPGNQEFVPRSLLILPMLLLLLVPLAYVSFLGLAYKPVFDDIWPVIGWTGVALIPVGAFGALYLTNLLLGGRAMQSYALALIIAGGAIGDFAPFATLPYLNGHLDSGRTYQKTALVLNGPIDANITPYVTVKSWRRSREVIMLLVPESPTYQPDREWTHVTLTVHPGWLGYEWFDKVERAGEGRKK